MKQTISINHHVLQQASGFERIKDDVEFDPVVHLHLGEPASTLSLQKLGYGTEINKTTPTQIAMTNCFQVLSGEGVAALHHVCKQLEKFTTSNPRIERNTRGGVYRSKFLRDFSLSTDVAAHLSKIMQTPLQPHAMGHQLSHLNYAPQTVGKNVDKWHYDTLQVDYVLFVTDPNTLEGGRFQYFLGTREEFVALKQAGKPLDPERIVSPAMPGAGYAVLMQGNYVVHQATALQKAAERITLVNGYNYADMGVADYTALSQLTHADSLPEAVAEYSRLVGLRCAQQFAPMINDLDSQLDFDERLKKIKAIRSELDQAISQLENCRNEEMRHFGD